MKQVLIPIGNYAGYEVMPAIYAKRGITGDYYVDFDNIAISEPAVVDLGADTIICNGSTITLDAGAAPAGYTYSYLWKTLNYPNIISTAQTIVTDSAGTYIVTVGNGFGLITNDTVTLSANPAAVSLGNDTTVCFSCTLDAGAGYDSYTWSGGQTSQTIAIDASGTGTGTFIYYVDVTKGSCSASDTVRVTFTACVGNIKNNNNLTVCIVPNPTTGITNFLVTGIKKYVDIHIYSLLGQLMYADKIAGSSATGIDLSSLTKGVYVVRIFNENTSTLKKLVIQ